MRTAIIGAMEEEITPLIKNLNNYKHMSVYDIDFHLGSLFGHDVIISLSGIGKVNASLHTTLLIEKFKVQRVLFTGVAGGLTDSIKIKDIVLGEELIQHDFDVTAFGAKLGEIPRMDSSTFKSDRTLLNIAKEESSKLFPEIGVHTGVILSGDQFIAKRETKEFLVEEFNGLCAEMEGAAVAHVCSVIGIPFLIIRSISDTAREDSHLDFQAFVKEAALISSELILAILNRLD